MHFQRIKWRHDSRNALCWSFCCVNDNKPIDVKCFQLMRCNICYANLISIIKCQNTSKERCNIIYFINGINALKKHVYVHHYVIEKIFKEKVNNLSKKPFEKEPTKK